MPVVIGAKPESSFADPFGLLTGCHRRIEGFLSVLVQVAAEAQGGPLTAEQRSALDTALRYFREAAPKHTADEEQSLFPRLQNLDSPRVKAVLAQVDALKGQHIEADRSHAEIDQLGQLWLSDGFLPAADTVRLLELLTRLSELYKGHIALEEGQVFPAAAEELGQLDRKAIGSEMAARRGLSQVE
ncbi:MAG: hemerythrin domain-containing protein [Acidobacteriota bacterium]